MIEYFNNLNIQAILKSAAEPIPLIVLQIGTLLGVISVLMIINRGSIKNIQRSRTVGFVLGISCFTVTGLLSQWSNATVKPYVFNDYLFLSGFLGGIPNALITGAFISAGRALFSSSKNLWFSIFDIMTVAVLSGLLLHRNILHLGNISISRKDSIKILFWRCVIPLIPILVIFLINPALRDATVTIAIQRILAFFVFSILIFYLVILLIKRELAWERRIYTDAVSKLPNRRALQNDLEKIRDNTKLTLLYINIDNFFSMVQELGFPWGDNFLRKLGKKVSTVAKQSRLSAYQGKVYVFSEHSLILLLRNITLSEIQERRLAEEITQQLAIDKEDLEGGLKVWLTTGVFDILEEHLSDPRRFLRNMAMVKHSSEKNVQYYHSDITNSMQYNTHIRQCITKWIREKRAPMWLQPKMCLSSGQCIGAEALMRVTKNDQEEADLFVNPHLILSVASMHRMLYELEWAIIETIIYYIEQMPPSLANLKFSVNLSPASLAKEGFAKRLCDLLDEKKIIGERLFIELIETSQLPATDEVVRENIMLLSEAGVGLSLDDFGSGYASISLLSYLPFIELKLDYFMISKIDTPRGHAAIMMAVEGAKRYNASVVAEGVETAEQRMQLLNMGIDKGQGYLFGKAMPLKDFFCYVSCSCPQAN